MRYGSYREVERMRQAENNVGNYLRLEFPSLPENIGVARLAVASFASRLPFSLNEIQHDVRVAVSEVVTNSVVHAYPDGPGIISVEAALVDGSLAITVTDSGRGFDSSRTPEADPEGEHMGIGLIIVKACMDIVQIETALGHGTIVRMRKTPSQAAQKDEVSAAVAE
jgi:stage II sporulation protein AB (anti-sigma F factor)